MGNAVASNIVQLIVNELQTRCGALSATEAAQLTNRSKRSFRHQFTRTAGINFRTARVKAKLERGVALLHTTNLDIPEISAQLGYSDRTKFEKAFKRFYGMTPTRYRLKYAIHR